MIERIHNEIEYHREGRPAHIRFKINSIVDEATIDALYTASQAGVPIDIWVRGICALRPGMPGLSETIRVRSILGRFLEHSRVFAFDGGGSEEHWIGSADLMHRNLDRRVEALVRLKRREHADGLDRLFDLAFDDDTASWHLQPDGTWIRHRDKRDGTPAEDLQETLIDSKHRRGLA